MDEEGNVRIADYGLAVGGLWDDKKTTGVAGTRGFMAPEVCIFLHTHNFSIYYIRIRQISLGVPCTFVKHTTLLYKGSFL